MPTFATKAELDELRGLPWPYNEPLLLRVYGMGPARIATLYANRHRPSATVGDGQLTSAMHAISVAAWPYHVRNRAPYRPPYPWARRIDESVDSYVCRAYRIVRDGRG